MTERINVSAKTTINRIHAVSALLLWIIIGIVVFKLMSDSYFFDDFAWIGIIGGIIIGIIRLFIINDKYAWQVATIEEIRDLKILIENKTLSNNSSSTSNDSSSDSTGVWVCTHCGENNPIGTRFCKKCGK